MTDLFDADLNAAIHRATNYPDGEGPPDPDAAKQRVEELLKTHTAPKGPDVREDDLDDPAKQEPGDA